MPKLIFVNLIKTSLLRYSMSIKFFLLNLFILVDNCLQSGIINSMKTNFTLNKKQIHYEWKSVIAPSGKDNSLKRQSDWEQSEKCDCCNADIVHVFEIDGKKFGYDCLKDSLKLKGIATYKNSFLSAEKYAYGRQKNIAQNITGFDYYTCKDKITAKSLTELKSDSNSIIFYSTLSNEYIAVSSEHFRLPARVEYLQLI